MLVRHGDVGDDDNDDAAASIQMCNKQQFCSDLVYDSYVMDLWMVTV